ncbi:hypothetical protein IF1G_05833 [Cordyceps javanica]|uniref:Uncharacterized protein n=1 Tax=Cordyceps javanica TaxID=43265 RepID=A0A545V2R9_9HYPO|nr:hypothetical protein IF1G_05833 [Cordyceps javanica]
MSWACESGPPTLDQYYWRAKDTEYVVVMGHRGTVVALLYAATNAVDFGNLHRGDNSAVLRTSYNKEPNIPFPEPFGIDVAALVRCH